MSESPDDSKNSVLLVSVDTIYLDAKDTGSHFYIISNCDSLVKWNISVDADWLSVSPVFGSIRKDDSLCVDISLEYTKLPKGTHHGKINIYAGGDKPVAAVMVKLIIGRLINAPRIAFDAKITITLGTMYGRFMIFEDQRQIHPGFQITDKLKFVTARCTDLSF